MSSGRSAAGSSEESGTESGSAGKKLLLADGKYEVNVTAYDASGHSSGARSRSFVVDSTAPVFIVSKPNSVKIDDPASYGRSVQITGTICEDNGTKEMKVRIFKVNRADGTEEEVTLAKNTFTGFDYSNPTVTIAKFFVSEPTDENDRALYENYRLMYGLSDADEGFDTTKYYYAIVSFKDNADNISDKTYIDSGLKSIFTSDLETSLDDYSTLKNLLNGSYSGTMTEEKKAKALDILNGTGDYAGNNYLATAEKKLAFTINSKANPTYSFDYYYSDKDADTFSQISRASLLNIDINSGLDKDAVKPETIKVRIYKIDTATNFSETLVKEIDGHNIYQNNEPIFGKETPVTSAKYTIKLSDFENLILSGKYYRVEVEGLDTNNNALIPLSEMSDSTADNRYGFMVQANSVPPVISFSIKDGTYRKASEFKASAYESNPISYSVKDESGIDVNLTVQTKAVNGYLTDSEVTDELKNLDTFDIHTETLVPENESTFNKELKINLEKTAPLEETNYTVIVRVTAESETATTKTLYFYADNKVPYF